MASPTQTTTPPPQTEFDLYAFWIQHARKITIGAVVLVTALALYYLSVFLQERTRQASARLLAEAKDAEGWRKVIAQFAGTPAAGDAHLLLGEQLRKDAKLDESAATLREFIDKYPEHPLLSGAWTSLGATLEAQGRTDEALSAYQKVSTTYPTSFSAPFALLSQARIFKQKEKPDEAKRLYQQVISAYPETIFAQLAGREMQQMK